MYYSQIHLICFQYKWLTDSISSWNSVRFDSTALPEPLIACNPLVISAGSNLKYQSYYLKLQNDYTFLLGMSFGRRKKWMKYLIIPWKIAKITQSIDNYIWIDDIGVCMICLVFVYHNSNVFMSFTTNKCDWILKAEWFTELLR